jgi:hypothetical protein
MTVTPTDLTRDPEPEPTWTIAELEAANATVSDAEAAFPDVDHLETDVT